MTPAATMNQTHKTRYSRSNRYMVHVRTCMVCSTQKVCRKKNGAGCFSPSPLPPGSAEGIHLRRLRTHDRWVPCLTTKYLLFFGRNRRRLSLFLPASCEDFISFLTAFFLCLVQVVAVEKDEFGRKWEEPEQEIFADPHRRQVGLRVETKSPGRYRCLRSNPTHHPGGILW